MSINPSRGTSSTIAPELLPSAIRMPISFRRCVTRYARTPR